MMLRISPAWWNQRQIELFVELYSRYRLIQARLRFAEISRTPLVFTRLP